MFTNAPDCALFGELFDHRASDGTVDLVLVAEGGAGDAEDLGDFRCDLGPFLLVKEHFIVKLILYLDLGPGLLLGLCCLLGGIGLGGLAALGILAFIFLFGLRENKS